MPETWSPRCQKCGGRGRAEVTPPPQMVFAGRLRPEAMKPYGFGARVRCTKCLTWFTIGPGTEWRPNPAAEKPRVAEPLPEDDGGSADLPEEPDDAVR